MAIMGASYSTRGGARLARPGVDVGEARLHFGNAMRVGGAIGLGQQAGAFGIGSKDGVEKRDPGRRHFLRHTTDAGACGQLDTAALQCQLAPDQPEERGLAGAVAADEADPRARHDLRGGVIDQQASGDPDGNVGDGQHGGFFTAQCRERNSFRRFNGRCGDPARRLPRSGGTGSEAAEGGPAFVNPNRASAEVSR